MEAGELAPVALAHSRTLGGTCRGQILPATHAVLNVVREVAGSFDVFAVVDNVHATGDLPIDDLSDRARQAPVESHVRAFTGGEQLVQVLHDAKEGLEALPAGASDEQASKVFSSLVDRFLALS